MENNKWHNIFTIDVTDKDKYGNFDARASLSKNHFGEVAEIIVNQMNKYPKFKEAVMTTFIREFGKCNNPNAS